MATRTRAWARGAAAARTVRPSATAGRRRILGGICTHRQADAIGWSPKRHGSDRDRRRRRTDSAVRASGRGASVAGAGAVAAAAGRSSSAALAWSGSCGQRAAAQQSSRGASRLAGEDGARRIADGSRAPARARPSAAAPTSAVQLGALGADVEAQPLQEGSSSAMTATGMSPPTRGRRRCSAPGRGSPDRGRSAAPQSAARRATRRRRWYGTISVRRERASSTQGPGSSCVPISRLTSAKRGIVSRAGRRSARARSRRRAAAAPAAGVGAPGERSARPRQPRCDARSRPTRRAPAGPTPVASMQRRIDAVAADRRRRVALAARQARRAGQGAKASASAQARSTTRVGGEVERPAQAEEVGIAVGGDLAAAERREAEDRVARVLEEARRPRRGGSRTSSTSRAPGRPPGRAAPKRNSTE